jgi:histidine decarboxylase
VQMLHAFQTLEETVRRVRVARSNHLGYPYNLVSSSPVPSVLGNCLLNNLGDPYSGSHFASEVCDLEREIVEWLVDLWQYDESGAYWGSVGSSGTEGNLWALYLAREALPGAVLLHSKEAHYSIPKSARILGIETSVVECEAGGAIDIDAFERALRSTGGRPVIVALTCGTTMNGAHDDIAAVMERLDSAGYGPDRRFVHVDGALNAMVVPFISEAPRSIRPSFRNFIDSVSTSGHKMIGTPMPCGILITHRHHVDRVAASISYLRSNDTTLMGSRNGHAVLAIWARLVGHGRDGFTSDIRDCLKRTDGLVEKLSSANVPTLRNPFSLTVVFPEPPAAILRKYQLASDNGQAHAIVMPSVSDILIDRFLDEYLGWWRRSCRSACHTLADITLEPS